MKLQHQSVRKARTRQLITAGGLLQKSGLLEVFHINPDDDLQDYENRENAAALLGFLIESYQKNDFDELNLERWRIRGGRALKSG